MMLIDLRHKTITGKFGRSLFLVKADIRQIKTWFPFDDKSHLLHQEFRFGTAAIIH